MSCCSPSLGVIDSIEGLFWIKKNTLRDFLGQHGYQFKGVGVSGARNSGRLGILISLLRCKVYA